MLNGEKNYMQKWAIYYAPPVKYLVLPWLYGKQTLCINLNDLFFLTHEGLSSYIYDLSILAETKAFWIY
jgi:hypothetical protein